jgi:hypothetical protein
MPATQLASPSGAAIVPKLEYARMRDRHPSAISHWIRTRKLTAPALVGTGRNARINVAEADRQLADTLSLSHQLGTAIREPGRDIFATPAAAPSVAAEPLPPSEPTTPSDQARLLRARAEREEFAAQKAAAEAQANNGTWVVRADSDREHGRRLAEAITTIERWLPELAQKLVAAPPTDVRAASIMLRTEFRALRATMAGEARTAAEAEPTHAAA